MLLLMRNGNGNVNVNILQLHYIMINTFNLDHYYVTTTRNPPSPEGTRTE